LADRLIKANAGSDRHIQAGNYTFHRQANQLVTALDNAFSKTRFFPSHNECQRPIEIALIQSLLGRITGADDRYAVVPQPAQIFGTAAKFSDSAAPAATLLTAGPRPAAPCRGTIMASTPAASAVRIHAPKL